MGPVTRDAYQQLDVSPPFVEIVHVIEGGSGRADLALRDGWTQREERAEEERTLHLPAPCTVFFFRNGDSYQGPA